MTYKWGLLPAVVSIDNLEVLQEVVYYCSLLENSGSQVAIRYASLAACTMRGIAIHRPQALWGEEKESLVQTESIAIRATAQGLFLKIQL